MVSKAVLLPPAEMPRGRTGGAGSEHRPAPPWLPLLPLANRPLLDHALDALDAAGIREVAVVAPAVKCAELRAVVTGPQERRLRLSFVEQEQGGLAAALDAVRPFVGDEVFLVNLLEGLARDDLRPYLQANGHGPLDVTVLAEQSDGQPGGEVVALRRGPLDDVRTAGLYLLGPGVLGIRHEACEQASYERALAAAVESLVAQGGKLDVHTVERSWRYQRGAEFLLEGNRLALEGLRRDTQGASLVDTDVQGPVVVDPYARVESSILRGPAIIGPGAVLRDAYVGPYTSIGADVRIEGAEIENSIVLPHACISHLAGRLESSVLGTRSRVTRDFRLPRALRLNVGEDAEVCIG